MRYPLQSIVTAALMGCLLALVAADSGSSPTSAPTGVAARHQPALSITPTPAASATALRGSGSSTPSASALVRPTPTPALTLELDANLPLEAPDDARGEPPLALDKWDARPPRRPMSLATTGDLASDAAASSGTQTIHRVKAGDTVYQLSLQHGVSLEAILRANSLDEQGARSLDIGQELVIPLGPEGDDGQPPLPVPRVMHQVQAGEALIVIAQDYGTTVESIVAANGLVDSELILAGQELIVPVPPAATLAPPAESSPGTELLTQTDALAAKPQLTLAEPITPTAALTQPLVMTQTDTADMVLEMSATEPISIAQPLAETPAITETVPTGPVTGTAGIEEMPAPEPLMDTAQEEAGPAAELAMLEATMLEAVNAEREAHGLPAYRLDDTLAAVARAHAQDMVARDYVGHTSPEGERVRGRMRDAGIDLDRAGENYYVTTQPAEEAVAHTLSWFMDDPPHRHNILHDYYTRIGVGVAYKPPGWYIFVLDFAGD